MSLHALVQLEEITSGIMAFVALLVKEHEALYDWKQNATNHFLDRDSLCIGTPLSSHALVRHNMDYKISSVQHEQKVARHAC